MQMCHSSSYCVPLGIASADVPFFILLCSSSTLMLLFFLLLFFLLLFFSCFFFGLFVLFVSLEKGKIRLSCLVCITLIISREREKENEVSLEAGPYPVGRRLVGSKGQTTLPAVSPPKTDET